MDVTTPTKKDSTKQISHETINGESKSDKEERRKAFKEFCKSLPRTCSPTICGTLNSFSSPRPGEHEGSEDWRAAEFNWSIDQIAMLNPCDISFDEEFNGELTNLMDSSLERENEEFFKQLEILPSPSPAIYRRYEKSPGDSSFLSRLNRMPPGDRSTPCTPPPARSASRTARMSSVSSLTPCGNKTKNKKKLFNDNAQDNIPEDKEDSPCIKAPQTLPSPSPSPSPPSLSPLPSSPLLSLISPPKRESTKDDQKIQCDPMQFNNDNSHLTNLNSHDSLMESIQIHQLQTHHQLSPKLGEFIREEVALDSGAFGLTQEATDLTRVMSFLSPIVARDNGDNLVDISMVSEKSPMDQYINMTPIKRRPRYCPQFSRFSRNHCDQFTGDSGCPDFTSLPGLTSTPSSS